MYLCACVCKHTIYVSTYIIIRRCFRSNANFAITEWEQKFATEPLWYMLNCLDPDINLTFEKNSKNIDVFYVNYSVEKNKLKKIFQLLLKLEKNLF